MSYVLMKKNPLAPIGLYFSKPSANDNQIVIPLKNDVPDEADVLLLNLTAKQSVDEHVIISALNTLFVDSESILDDQIKALDIEDDSTDGYQPYAISGLMDLIDLLNKGNGTTEDGLQPYINFEYNGEVFQWGAFPIDRTM